MDDVLFTFGTKSFENAMQVMSGGVNMLLKRVALIGAGFLSVRKAMAHMPEIGRTFSIAGNIIGKNLLWPLRKQLLPLLQKLLDWVRDHRAAFVRWGTYLVNIFKIIKNIVSGFIDILNKMWERLSSNIERIFGKTTKSMSEIINIMLFKVSAMASFILMTLEPVFEMIVDAWSRALENSKAFFSGFIDGFGEVGPILEDLGNMLMRVADLLGLTSGATSEWSETFYKLGNFLGGAFKATLLIIASAIDNMVLGFKMIGSGYEMLKSKIFDSKSEYEKVKKREMASLSQDASGLRERSAIRDKQFETAKQSMANSFNSNSQTNNTNLNVEPITINVTEGSAIKAGEDFGKGLQNKLIDQDVLSGGRR